MAKKEETKKKRVIFSKNENYILGYVSLWLTADYLINMDILRKFMAIIFAIGGLYYFIKTKNN